MAAKSYIIHFPPYQTKEGHIWPEDALEVLLQIKGPLRGRIVARRRYSGSDARALIKFMKRNAIPERWLGDLLNVWQIAHNVFAEQLDSFRRPPTFGTSGEPSTHPPRA